MPLCAAGALPCATVCQVWNGVPIAQVVTRAWTVGTAQLTSPTSVEPSPPSWLRSSGAMKSQRARSLSGFAPIRLNVAEMSAGRQRLPDLPGEIAVRVVEGDRAPASPVRPASPLPAGGCPEGWKRRRRPGSSPSSRSSGPRRRRSCAPGPPGRAIPAGCWRGSAAAPSPWPAPRSAPRRRRRDRRSARGRCQACARAGS